MDYDSWHVVQAPSRQPMAALAVRSAANEPLFLETYFADPIEQAVSKAFRRTICRSAIVEIGCLAATPTPAMLRLWSQTAVSLLDRHEIAVATLTLPLRRMFARVGLPFVELAPADPERLRDEARGHWGQYYEAKPVVCAGDIAAGLVALKAFATGGRA